MLEDTIVVAQGSTFAVSGRNGDIATGDFHGLFKADTRFLSRYTLRLNGQALQTLSSANLLVDSASFYLTTTRSSKLGSPPITVIRDRQIDETGLHDELTVTNHGQRNRPLQLEICFDADFADV